MASTPAPVLLHRTLGLVVLTLAAGCAALIYAGIIPLMNDPDATRLLGYVFASIPLVAIALVLGLLKPRVPSREAWQSVDDYWGVPEVSNLASVIWFMLEGSSVLAAVGLLLTGKQEVAGSLALAVACYWWLGPWAFSGR